MRFRWMATGSKRFSLFPGDPHFISGGSMSKSKPRVPKRVKAVRIDQIRLLNPRARNQRNFQEIVQSIAKVGLKRPITVRPRKSETDSASYDLVCGQGRIEAFLQLGQTEIPAIVIDAEESDCLVMSLVENCARRFTEQ
jgi:ParB family chromosome partitioning protein